VVLDNLMRRCLEWDVLIDAPDHAEVTQARRREQNRILKCKARQRMTPEQRDQLRASDRMRKMAATPEQRQRRRENDRQHSGNLHAPFWGVDGEGAGLAGAWKDVPRNIGFDWSTKRHPTWEVRFAKDGSDSLTTMPLSQSKLDESQGYEPANFDWSVEIADDDGRSVMIDDDDLLFEAMPDHVTFLPHEE
jgi:hypothetical protein